MVASARRKWLVVVGATIALTVGNGPIFLFTFGIFIKPVSEEFGWSRGTMSLGLLIGLTLGGLATPVFGRLVDRWGSQEVTLVVITLFAASFAAIGLTPNNIVLFILLYSACGLIAGGQAPLPYAKTISGWFQARRGLALGIAMAGIGVGIAVMPVMANAFVQRLGWRGAYAMTGLVVWLIAFPMVLLFVKNAPTVPGKVSQSAEGDTFAIAIRQRSLWLIAVASFLVVTALNGVIAHLVALLTDAGVPEHTAVSTIVVVGLATIAGRLASGFLLDRFFAPYVAAAIFLVPLVATAVMLSGMIATPFVIGAAACLGLALGAEVDVIGYLVGRYFGLRCYGEIYGYIFAAFAVGSGVGPYMVGLSFDQTGSYRLAIEATACVLIAASVLIAMLGPYRFPALLNQSARERVADGAAVSDF